MKALLACIAYFALGISAAIASGYGDFNSGVAAANRDDADNTIKYLTLAIAESDLPAHLLPDAHVTRGIAYDSQRKYDAAIADYSAAIALRPTYTRAYLERCGTHGLKKEYDAAIADCSAAIRLQPEDWRLYAMRIDQYLAAKRYDDALADYALFIAKRPDDIDLKAARADILRQSGRMSEAIASATALRDASPKYVSPHLELGLIYFANNDLQKSLDSFSAVADIAKKDPTALIFRGQAEWALGKFDDAESSFEDALDLDELQPYSFLWLEITRARRSHKQSSRIAARFAATDLTLWPGPLILLYLNKSTPAEAMTARATAADSGSAYRCLTDFFVGEWYEQQGNNGEARRLLQEASGTVCDDDWRTQKFAAIDLARLP
ncbi:MAG TPA: tetratricopeptide repeat protein [Rhizomicrobium sp.]|jgi:tetratricopeptide (TPR) repeat protein|nr:tetratricopeptide repeat protein [Rhizomicrobium sp.]